MEVPCNIISNIFLMAMALGYKSLIKIRCVSHFHDPQSCMSWAQAWALKPNKLDFSVINCQLLVPNLLYFLLSVDFLYWSFDLTVDCE